MSLLAHVDHLRTLAQLDPDTSVFDLAVVNVLEELAAAVDRLTGEEPPDDGERLGTI
jgi:hypothetical protein